MKVSKPAIIACLVAAVAAAPRAFGDDLLDVYRSALQNDPTLAAARANWQATQERVPQARSGLLPNVSLSIAPNVNYFGTNLDSDPHTSVNRNFGLGGLTVSAAQPLYRYANTVAYSQAVEQVRQADYTLEAVKEDLILRVATSYFNVLLAQFTVELAESQKAAVSEQLAQAKRNFEVGVATITDTNEAQAKYDQIVAQEITARNDLENQRTALRAIIGRNPGELKRLGGGFEPALPSPNNPDKWVDQALADNLSVRIAQYNADIATLEIERQRAGRLPTVDLVASANAQVFNSSVNTNASGEQHQVAIGFAVNVPLYTGGFVDSKVREAYALQDNARQNLEVARRNALFNAQTGFTGVTSAVASVKAFEQALASAQTAYESNKTGLEVGVRTNLDVLNTQQNVYQARHDVAQAYFNYMLSLLRLKSAVGTLSDQDVEAMNRRLRG